jgi:hypothetical protein
LAAADQIPLRTRHPARCPQGPTHQWIFFLFFLVRCGAFLGKGSSKTPKKTFLQKVHVEKFPKQIDKNFDVSPPLVLFWVYRVFGCLAAMGVQKHYKKRLAKNRVGSFLQKKTTKNRQKI